MNNLRVSFSYYGENHMMCSIKGSISTQFAMRASSPEELAAFRLLGGQKCGELTKWLCKATYLADQKQYVVEPVATTVDSGEGASPRYNVYPASNPTWRLFLSERKHVPMWVSALEGVNNDEPITRLELVTDY
jgi:hypothetical protein